MLMYDYNKQYYTDQNYDKQIQQNNDKKEKIIQCYSQKLLRQQINITKIKLGFRKIGSRNAFLAIEQFYLFTDNSLEMQNCGTQRMKPAGILYAIVQDTSNCYSCPVGQTWDPMTCSCICADHCDCVLPQIFFGFPTCQCGCIQTVLCASNYYFDQNCCSCKCLPLACDWAHIFDEASCSCICPKTLWCEMGYIFSDITCTCIKISIPGESSSCESSSEENWGAGPV